MRFPKMRPQGARRLSVPDLAGGLNLRDGVSEVLDNQLTQAKNVWWQDGVLKTRPGIYIDENQKVENGWYQSDVEVKAYPHIKRDMNGDMHILQVGQCVDGDTTSLQFFWVGEDRTGNMSADIMVSAGSYFVTEKDGIIYIYTQHNGIYKWDYLNDTKIEKVLEDEYYIPTALTNCLSGDSVAGDKPRGDAFEGFNLLTPYYKAIYSTVNKDILSDEKTEHNMYYILPFSAFDGGLNDVKITVKITYKDGKTATHQIVTRETSATEAEVNTTDNLKMRFTRNLKGAYISFYTSEIDADGDELLKFKKVSIDDYLENNMEITAPKYSILDVVATIANKQKVFSMTQCEWFGGGTEGIAGGTRLFLGGNTSEENKNLVIWSDLNNPLYFPENNYFRVGENSSAVTAFGRQADMLVIFKENGSGIYYTKYQQNNDIEAEDLINQSVVDYVASSVYFPLVQINPNIGCSYPDTIQLCRNRLVWLGDNGNVYTLVSESQYNERSVFCVSEMVARDLKRNIEVNATACDWEGYYCLMCGNKLYLMDYNCYGYTHVASYSKTEDANIRIPWYIWELPVSGAIFTIGDTMMFSNYNSGCDESTCCYLHYTLKRNNGTADTVYVFDSVNSEMALENHPIETVLRTKLFTFGEASTRKSVDKINLQLGNNGGEPITVKVITDQSEEEHDIYLSSSETQAYTPGYIDSKAIFPTARNFLRIGLELSSEGVVAVDGMEFKFRTNGGAR